MMAAEDALDPRVLLHDGAQRGGVAAVDGVHVLDPADNRRVVHHDERRALGCRGELALEPGQALRAQLAVGLAGHQRVECQDAQGARLDRILDEAGMGLRPGSIGEGGAEGLARVVIAGNRIDRHWQPVELGADQPVFLLQAAIDEIAADEHEVGCRAEREHRVDGTDEEGPGIDDAVGRASRRSRVEVRELGDQHQGLME